MKYSHDNKATESAEVTAPTSETSTPSVQPAAGASEGTAEAGKPAADASEGTADAGKPAADASEGTADAGKPAAGASEGTADAGKPAAGASEGTADAGKPAAGANRGTSEEKKQTTPTQYALMSAFIYPGAGQIARGQKSKGLVMIIFFTIFLVIWGIYVAKGIIYCYNGVQIDSEIPNAMEIGVDYLKHSLIPGAVAAIVFCHSVYDAYKG